jgi:peptidoglycan-associated lipoprotein
MKTALMVFCAAAAFALVGCNRSNTLPDTASTGGAGGDSSASGGTTTSGAGGGSGIQVSPVEAERQRLLQQLVVYFDFDQAEIKPEFNAMLAAHGQYLAQNSNVHVRLEGNTDERGTREYNIGLGERRAQAVKRALLLQGATNDQITTISYGEERPVATGSDEESWRLNRRVEIVYRR